MKIYLPLFIVLMLSIHLKAQISNDYCYSASEIVLAPEGFGQMYSGYYAMATASYVGGNSCNVAPAADFWYKFVATSTTLKLTNNITSGSNALLTVYKNSCYNLEEVYCYQGSTAYIANLTIGNIYYIKAQKYISAALFFSFKAEEGINIPNGFCNTAELVTVDQGGCSTSHYFSTIGQSGVAKPSCATGDVHDVWFQMVAPPSGCIEIVEGNGHPLFATIYTNDCNSLAELDCVINTNNDPYVPGLTPGETYLIRLYTSQSSSIVYDVCFKEGPASLPNDECSNSISLSIPATCSEDIIINPLLATKSMEPGCYVPFQEKEDVWYDFIAPATGNVVLEKTGGSNFYFGLYEGACGNLTDLFCNSLTGSNSFAFTQLVSGNSYTLRISRHSSYYGTINFCLYEGAATPSENACATASPLTVQSGTCTTEQSLDWTFLSPSGEVSPCAPLETTDAWYSFTAPSTGNIEFSGLNTSIFKTIYSGSCGSLTAEVCVIGNYISGLIPNEDYLLLLSRYATASTSNFCLLEYTIGSINNTCASAELLTNNSNFIPDWGSAAFETDGNNTCEFRPHDVWYSFEAPASGAVKFSGPSGNNKYFEVYEGSCGSLTQLACFRLLASSGNYSIVGNLTPGSIYYAKVYDRNHVNQTMYTFSFNAVTPPINNECTAAIEVTPEANCTSSTDINLSFVNASLSDVPLPDCNTWVTSYFDLWYTFDAPANGAIKYEDSGVFGYIALYENSCGSFNQIYCGSANTVVIDSLDPDTTYYFRVISSTRNSTSFCILESNPENEINTNTCEAPATGILFGDNACGPLVEFNMSDVYPVTTNLCGGAWAYWYEFIAPSSGSFNFQLFQGSSNANIAIYEGACENLNEVYCMPLGAYETKLINGLVGGQTYLLRYSTFSPSSSDTKFCVSAVSPPSEESTCTEALEILASTDDACDQIISGSTLSAGESAGAFCGANITNAVFYTFTPAESASYAIVLSNAAATHRITVFENCALQSPITCGLMETIASFMDGNTYIIAVYPEINTIRSSFDLCIFKPDPALMTGSVGINVPNPQTRLDVNGGIKPGYSEEMLAGNIRWSTDLEVYDGISWKSLIGWDYQATEDINMLGHRIKNLNTPIMPTHAATKQYVDAHTDADSDPLNEIQTISKSGSTVTLSDGGGSFADAVDDADNDPNNEIETWSTLAGIPSDFADDIDNVDDADNDPTNEIETWSTLAGIPSDFADDIDNVDDADNDPTNEIETWSTLAGIPTDFADDVDNVDDADNDPTNEIETWSTLAGIPADFADEIDNVVDADNDPTNEIETWSTLAGIPTDFADDVDNVDDADNDPTNEIETWSTLAGIPNDFADNTDNVDDADNDPTNEIETWSTLAGIPNDFADNTDNVDDADNDPTNEIETWSTLAGIPAGFLDGIDEAGAFTHNGNVVVNTGNHDTNDFAFGRASLPAAASISDTLLFFDKSKGAFRSGQLLSTKAWAPDSIGGFSFSSGYNTIASGLYSVALGDKTRATGQSSISLGQSAQALAQNAMATGYNTMASGESSFSSGFGSIASGGVSFATGQNTIASNVFSFASGLESEANGIASFATGNYVNADAVVSFALGQYNVGGGSNSTWISTDPIFEIGIGTSGSRKNAMTVLKNGRVGIGTATPAAPLDITSNGNSTTPQLKLTESAANDGARIIFSNDVETDNRWTLYGLADNTDASSTFNIFYNGIGNIITANGLGNVGIKCAADADFHIRHSNSGGSGGFKLQNSANDEFARLYVSSGDGNLRLYFDTTGLKGTFNDVNGVYSTVSDRRLKNNFQELDFDWHSFNQLAPLTYTYYNDDKSKRYIGMVAQDVLQIYPQLITYVEEEDRYTMDYSGFGVIAVKAIQEQQKIIDQQANVIQRQEDRLQKVEALLKSLLENQN